MIDQASAVLLERFWAPLFGEPSDHPDPMQTYLGRK